MFFTQPEVQLEPSQRPSTEKFVSEKETRAATGDREPPDKLTELPLITGEKNENIHVAFIQVGS